MFILHYYVYIIIVEYITNITMFILLQLYTLQLYTLLCLYYYNCIYYRHHNVYIITTVYIIDITNIILLQYTVDYKVCTSLNIASITNRTYKLSRARDMS